MTLALCLGLGATSLSAQRTWIVDAAGGPGSNFKTIEAAVAAASAGDRVRVLRGKYRGAVISKPIAVVGDTGAEIITNQVHPGFSITRIGAGRVAAVRGFRFPSPAGGTPVRVSKCAGRVVLADLAVSPGAIIQSFTITDAAAVSLDRCESSTATVITRSNVQATLSQFRFGGPLSRTAIAVEQSTLTLVQCQALVPTSTAAHAVLCKDSTIELRGTAAQKIQSGYQFTRGMQIIPLPAIHASGNSTLLADPDVSLLPIAPAGFRVDTRRELPWLTATGGKLGAKIELQLGSQARESFAVFVGLPGPVLPLANWGNLWLDSRLLLLVANGSFPASGETQLRRTVPSVPGFLGLALTYQTVTGAAPTLTNGASVMLYAR